MKKIVILFILCLTISFRISAQNLNLNEKCQAILSNPETGLVASDAGSYDYTYADRNATAIMNALKRLSKNQDLLLPEGTYYVNTILVAKTIKGSTIAGTGIGKTTLVRAGFSWDNNTQGDCTLRTEIFLAENMDGFELRDMTLDGNGHHMAISGYGKWNTQTGGYSDGLPQFPTYTTNDDFSESSGSLVTVRLSDNITFENTEFKNGYRWCLLLGKVNGFTMRNSIIDTGNLSTEFKGHFDPAPNNTVMHMHTSQDGLHMVNVSNALVEFNDIHSEDSAIAIEFNPAWNWGGYDIVENVIIKNNYVSTISPSSPGKLMSDEDLIYGTGLANEWMGQSAVDIFYNENFDSSGNTYYDGKTYFRNIEIRENAFENVRQGVRCGFFIGATLGHFNHRIYNLIIKDHEPSFWAGKDKNKPAGIRNVFKNTHSNSWNKSGGAGIAVRYTDLLSVSNNQIENCIGGLGISIENVTHFSIVSNRIDQVSGKQLGDLGSDWTGGEGIRINNRYLTKDPNLEDGRFNAGYFLVKGNYIGEVETTKIAVLTTKNGIINLNENYDLDGIPLCALDNGIYKANVSDIDWGNGCGSSIEESDIASDFTLVPGTIVSEDLKIKLLQILTGDIIANLFSLNGEKLYSCYLKTEITPIPMSAYPQGIYLLTIGEQNKNKLIKIIKQ